MATMMVKIIAPTLIKGVGASPGEIIELDAADGQLLIANSKAERYTPPGPTPEELAAAAAKAKTELLEQIAASASHDELEELLSEDPDIVAAYEKRLVELDEPNH